MDGDRNSNRGAASYVGKVALLVKYQRHGLRPARQPDGQAVSEPEGRVVPAVRNPRYRTIAEVGPVVPDEALDQVVSHFHRGWRHFRH
jgi:hypothetical protein